MNSSNKKLANVDLYIKAFPKNVQVILRKMRKTVREVVPNAEESISYGIPTFKVNGKNIIHFGGFKNHVSLFPGGLSLAVFKKELEKYKLSKGTIQFLLDKPLPLNLIKRVTQYCLKERLKSVKGTGYDTAAKKPAAKFNYIKKHNDGSVWAKGNIKDGKMDGYWEWFRKDGTRMRSGYFKVEKQVGKWTTYDKKGKVYKVTDIG